MDRTEPAYQLMELEPGSALDRARVTQVSSHWHENCTPAQSAERDALMRSSDAWTRERKRAFALVEPGGTAPLVSCELWRHTAVVADGSGGVREGVTVGFASVFTPQENRGKGLAAELITRVLARAREEEPQLLGATLCSEIGPRLYERLGFASAVLASHDWELLVPSPAPVLPAGVRLLSGAEADAAAEAVCAATRRAVAAAPAGAIAVLPLPAQLRWPCACFATRARVLGAPPPPEARGAACGDAVCVWTLDAGEEEEEGGGGSAPLPPPLLRILALLPGGVAAEAAAVLAAAVAFAAQAGADRVLVWETDALTQDEYRSTAAPRRWAPPAAELAALGVTAQHVPRACRSLPMLLASDAAAVAPRADAWTWIPRGVWM